MADSMYAAISGLNAEQALLGVVAQNIANVNTVGYKSSHMTFAQSLMQTLSGGSAPTATNGGTNPIQEAAGGAVNVGGVAVNMSEGTLQSTGINTNLAIQGQGFFIIQTPQGIAYTRAGDFSLDAAGNLVTPQGGRVMGWSGAVVSAKGQTATNLVPIQVPPITTMPPVASTNVTISGNLNSADAGTGVTKTVPLTLYDSLGNPQSVILSFTNPTATTGAGVQWTVKYQVGTGTPTTLGTLSFPANGAPATFTSSAPLTVTPTDGASSISITLNSQDFAGTTGYASATNLTAIANGNPPGSLDNFTVGANGTLTGTFSNGLSQPLGQVALANFSNPGGLLNIGQSLWQQSANSGPAIVGQASSGALGSLAAGTLEGSNVSLAQQFVDMVKAQEGYQANSKVISISQANQTTLTNMIAP